MSAPTEPTGNSQAHKGDVAKVLSVSSLSSLRERLLKLEGTAYIAAYDAESDFSEWATDAIAALEASERRVARLEKAMTRWECRCICEEIQCAKCAALRGDPNGL